MTACNHDQRLTCGVVRQAWFCGLQAGRFCASWIAVLVGLSELIGWSVVLSSPAIAQPSPEVLLTNIAQIKELTPGQASEGRPARIAACVVFHNSRGDCFIQDATEAMFLVRPAGRQNLRLGDRIIVEGTTAPGDYAAVLVERHLEVLGSGDLPEPQQVNCSQLASGQCDSRWVETEGVVRWIVDSRPSHILTQLALPDGKVKVYVFGWQEPDPQRFVGATLRVRAAAGVSFNQKRQFVGPFLFVNAPDNLTLVRVGSSDASSLPLTPATALLQFRAPGQSGNHVRVRGTVTHQVPGQCLFIRDGLQGLQLLTFMTNLVAPGNVVEARGFPVMGVYSPILEDADFQALSQTAPPLPVQTTIQKVLAGEHDADLVSLEAELIDSVRRDNEQIIVLQASNILFSAHLPLSGANDFHSEFPSRCRLRLIGVCQVQETLEQGSRLVPVSFRLLLRSREDLLILRRPPWWTPNRLLTALGILGLASLATVIWVWVLRGRVRAQTALIGETMRNKAVLEERTRLARELHDSIEQNLAGIAIQLDTAAAKFSDAPQTTSRLLDRSRQMMRRTQDELRSSVWNLRSHLFQAGGLEAALRTVTEPLTRAGIKADVKISGPTRPLPAVTETHLLRIAQEAINNVLKHARAKTVCLELRFTDQNIALRISDDGIGFEPATMPPASDGHFGFLGMRERAERLGGSLTFESAPGDGTRVCVEAPLPAHSTASRATSA